MTGETVKGEETELGEWEKPTGEREECQVDGREDESERVVEERQEMEARLIRRDADGRDEMKDFEEVAWIHRN